MDRKNDMALYGLFIGAVYGKVNEGLLRTQGHSIRHIKDMNKISTTAIIIGIVIIIGGLFAGIPAYGRYQTQKNNNITRQQALLNEQNQVQINEIQIQQTAQLVQVEQQKADIKVVEAQGIAKAQQIINQTLTDKYLQHEAIQAQSALANSPNHTTVYIPSGQNGIPLVSTVNN